MNTKLSADPRVTGLAWLALRLFIAYQWLHAAYEKLTDPAWTGADAPQAIHKFFTGALEKSTGDQPAVFGWYADFVRNVALPNELLFAYIITYGELLVGLALLIGLFTKWAAFWGAFMNLNYIFAGSASANGYMLAAEMAMVFGGLGVAYYGLDRVVLPYVKRMLGQEPPLAPTPQPVYRPGIHVAPTATGAQRRQVHHPR